MLKSELVEKLKNAYANDVLDLDRVYRTSKEFPSSRVERVLDLITLRRQRKEIRVQLEG
jgi:hypothetical protein